MGVNTNNNLYTLAAIRSCTVLALLYIVLVFALPPNQATMHAYHMNALGYRSLLSALLLPPIAIWFIAFYAYAKLYDYVDCLKDSPESAGMTYVAIGIKWLAWSLPISSLGALLVGVFTGGRGGPHAGVIIVNNYIDLILPLVAFSVIGAGARALISHAHINFSLSDARTIMFAFLAGGVAYCYLIFRGLGPGRLSSSHNSYALPIWLVVISIVIPYLYTWFIGLLAVLEISTYSRVIKGLLYRQPLRTMVLGLTAVIACSIAYQFPSTMLVLTGKLTLDYHILLRLVLNALEAIGFLAIAAGVIRLKRIEEV